MRIFYTLLTILLVASVSYGQEVIQGKVIDENGLPLIGATIQIDGIDNLGATSDLEGKFYLFDVPEGAQILKINFIGYKTITQEINVSGDTSMESIRMEPGVLIGNEVLVLGDRLKGQAKAINRQRTNQNITNVVAADQIGRFPDANIGDAVKRIPGITMQGDQGEARNIVIRGLAPQLNSVMINGNRIPSAEGDNRNIQMDLIPADMIQTIEVSKAITPDMDADAIGGAVNLTTRSAPEGQRISATFASGYNALSEKPIWTGGLIYGDKFLNNKLGAVVSMSYNDHQLGSDNIEAEWAEGDNTPAYVEEFQIRTYEVQRIRRSVSLNLDYEINQKNQLFFSSMYNWRDDWENRYRTVYGDIEEPDASGVSFVGALERQTKGGIGSDRVDYRRLEDQRVQSYSLGGKHLLGKAELTWNGAWSKASEERQNERYAEYVAEPEIEVDGEDEAQGILFFQDISDPEFPNFTPAPSDGTSLAGNDPSILDFSLFELNEITEEKQYTDETELSGRIDLKLPVAQKGFVKFGGRYRGKEKSRDNSFIEYSPLNDDIESLDLVPRINKSNSDFLPGSEYQAGQYASNVWLGDLDLNNSTIFEAEDKPDEYLAVNYNATENIVAGYGMIQYDLTPKFTATAGLRIEHTDLEYSGNVVENEEDFIEAVTLTDSYTNFLPGIHAKYDVNPNLIVRAAWTNSLARPNYFDLVPYRDNRVEDEELFLGNPELNPTTAMNLDLSVENYFKSIGLVSIGYFNKNIDDFIYVAASENSNGFDVFQPQNGGDGTINGVEVSVQRQLDFLPGALKGIGIYLNYTYTDSEATGVATEDGDLREKIGLPGTAKNLFNASLSYENKKFIVRGSLNYSSDYIDEVGGEAFSDRYYDEQLFLDVNASYAITPNWRIFAEANNLTNQALRYYQGVQNRTMQAEYYSTKYNLGVKFDLFK